MLSHLTVNSPLLGLGKTETLMISFSSTLSVLNVTSVEANFPTHDSLK